MRSVMTVVFVSSRFFSQHARFREVLGIDQVGGSQNVLTFRDDDLTSTVLGPFKN